MLILIGLLMVYEGQRELLKQLNDVAGSRTVHGDTLLQDLKFLQQCC